MEYLETVNSDGALAVKALVADKKTSAVLVTINAAGDPVKKTRKHSGPPKTYVREDIVARVPQFMERPGHRIYVLDHQPFVPDVALEAIGVTPDAIESAAESAYGREVRNVRIVGGEIKARSSSVPGWRLFSMAFAMRAFPDSKQALLQEFYHGQSHGGLPGYAIEGTEAGSVWVSTADVR
jgi:hypothetical protein